jgi:hypothetical protein
MKMMMMGMVRTPMTQCTLGMVMTTVSTGE